MFVFVIIIQQNQVDIHVAPRAQLSETANNQSDVFGLKSRPVSLNQERSMAYLPHSGQVVRALPVSHVPQEVRQGCVVYIISTKCC